VICRGQRCDIPLNPNEGLSGAPGIQNIRPRFNKGGAVLHDGSVRILSLGGMMTKNVKFSTVGFAIGALIPLFWGSWGSFFSMFGKDGLAAPFGERCTQLVRSG